MIAQDTGSAIVGPARADLYFGAGVEAGKVAGRLRHNARFVMLVPKSLDPVARGRKMPLPDARPSEKIAKLFPQTDPEGSGQGPKTGARPVGSAPATTPAGVRPPRPPQSKPVPLPEPRPAIKPRAEMPHHRHLRRHAR